MWWSWKRGVFADAFPRDKGEASDLCSFILSGPALGKLTEGQAGLEDPAGPHCPIHSGVFARGNTLTLSPPQCGHYLNQGAEELHGCPAPCSPSLFGSSISPSCCISPPPMTWLLLASRGVLLAALNWLNHFSYGGPEQLT